MDIDSSSMDKIKLPSLIAKKKKIRIAVFLANSHLFHRFRDSNPFLRTMRLKLRNQKNCIFCFYGDNQPFYLKLLTWHALIRTHHTCTTAIVEKALNDLVHHFDHHFDNIVESLTSRQLSFLKALLEGNQKLYSNATRSEYQLGSTSNVARITQSLERKEIIDTGRLGTVFTNPIFREWLRRCYFGKL